MKRFKNILAVYGEELGADNVFRDSIALAKANNARLTLIDVLHDRFTSQAEIEERRKRLMRLVPAVHAEGVRNISITVLTGQPYVQIIREVIRSGHDLVMVSSEGGSFFRTLNVGNTATSLMRKCPCPVWVIKPQQQPHYSAVMACIDPSANLQTGCDLDRMILDLSTSLASASNATLHVMHAWDVEGKDRDTLASETPDATRARILRKHKQLHLERVNELLSEYKLDKKRHKVQLPRGGTQRSILELVEKKKIDVVVMGTMSRAGISGLLLGNAAEDILAGVQCGVFAVKPKEFQTSVIQLREMEAA